MQWESCTPLTTPWQWAYRTRGWANFTRQVQLLLTRNPWATARPGWAAEGAVRDPPAGMRSPALDSRMSGRDMGQASFRRSTSFTLPPTLQNSMLVVGARCTRAPFLASSVTAPRRNAATPLF